MYRFMLSMFVGGLALSVSACGSDQVKAGGSVLPDWYMKGTPGCAVGSQKFRGNLSLAESGAIGKARTKLARQFKVDVKGMLKQYASEGGTEKGDMSEELTEDVTRQITDMSLMGTRRRSPRTWPRSASAILRSSLYRARQAHRISRKAKATESGGHQRTQEALSSSL